MTKVSTSLSRLYDKKLSGRNRKDEANERDELVDRLLDEKLIKQMNEHRYKWH